MKKPISLLFSVLTLATAAEAATVEPGLYPTNTTVRGYAKRDRLLIGGLEYVSPAQLHENLGLRARFEADSQNSELTKRGQKSKLDNPSVNASAAYGWEQLTLGLQASYMDSKNAGEEGLNIDEKFKATKFRPEISYTFREHLTAGAGLELNRLDVREEALETSSLRYDFLRGIVALAYHQPAFEVGATYTTEVQEQASLAQGARREESLSLASYVTPSERSVYLPSMGTVYARGNVNDHVSLMSSVSLARYDGNVEGAVALFDQYKTEDRLAAKLLGTYWTDERSRVTLAAEYKGAATNAIGSEESALGYRLVNLYGGSLEGVLSLDRRTYLGLNASYLRGERDQTYDATGERFNGKEDTRKVAGFVTMKL